MKDFIHISHGISSVLALLSGTYISFAEKGTPFHKKMGYLYVSSMLITITTSFGIFDLFNGFGIYHVMSLISLGSILLGMYFPLFNRKNPAWVIHHYFWMIYSFLGLVMALGSHCLKYFPPDWSFWTKGLIAWGLPYLLGTILVFKYKKEVEQRFYSEEPLNK